MIIIRRSLLILLVLAALGGCITPFDFESIGLKRSLVIDASLTTETKAHFVNLSFTFEIDTTRNDPVERATVTFVDDTGVRTILPERSPGHYTTDSSFTGIPGRTYVLEVSLPDGSEYRSDPELMPEPVPIDSIYGRYITIPTDDNDTDQTGVQVFLDSHSDDGEPKNFRYSYRESFETPVPYPSQYDWSGSGATFQIFEREKPLGTCYRKAESNTTIVGTTRGLSENRISEYPIRFINESARELAYSYIIEVSQFTISKNAHAFYRYLQESNEGTGSLSDRQLGSINGNISDVNDPLTPVLGYFEVAGVAKTKRIFSYHQFLDDGIRTEEWICLPLEDGQDLGEGCTYIGPAAWQVRFTEEQITINPRTGDTTRNVVTVFDFGTIDALVNDPNCGESERIIGFSNTGAQVLLAHELCGDCTLYGLLDRPSVWDD